MALRLAFDLDGVLADMESELVHQARTLFGRSATRRVPGAAAGSSAPASETTQDAVVDLHLTIRQERRLWRHVAAIEDFWESLPEIEEGAVARIAGVASERRWEVIFLTTRPEGAGGTAQVQTQRWLEAKGFRRPSVFVVHGSRGRVAAALGLDFVVDDRPENCLDVVVDSHARAILMWREGEHSVPVMVKRPGIGVANSVDDCLSTLSEADSMSGRRPGLVERIVRRMRFKETTEAQRGPSSFKASSSTSSKS